MQPGDERNLLLNSIPLVQAPSSVGERQKLLVRRHHTAPATRRGRAQPHRDYLPAGRRGLLQMLVRFACIDQHLGAVGPRLRREPAGIEFGRPGVAQDVDVFRRMAAGAQRPKHIVEVRRVDVFVHNDHPLRVIGGGRTLRSERQYQRRMPGTFLGRFSPRGPRGMDAS